MSPRRWRTLRAGLAAVCGAAGVLGIAAGGPRAQPPSPPSTDPAKVARGRSLFADGCSSCHGLDARGVRGQGPSLVGAGAAAADFYLSTGRMPLADPDDEPIRARPAYPRADREALVAYVGSLGGPAVPAVRPARGNLREGVTVFTEHCAGCHQVVARGGIVTGAAVPALQRATPREIAEAVRVGPYLMPRFSSRQISDSELDSIVRYVRSTRHPPDRGGWGVGHIGPIPEGMVAWLLAGAALLLVARLIGERDE
jgi:ubiquinol-cytochrome c reductase cytochrome c subunit